MTTETLTWIPVADRLPDDGLSVLICTTGTAEPVWVGYLDGEEWRDSEGDAVAVVAWAEMPRGTPISTASLSVDEFSLYLERVMDYAAEELGVVIE